jgi:NAD(P)H dehydrogenase (quinone)
MRVHVVYAHPVPDSFTGAAYRQIVAGLRARGHQVDGLDLYAERFDPVMSLAEREVHYRVGANRAGVEGYVERLRAAEILILCFPTWWYGMPAILKGWFDRVWLPGVAFHNPPGGGTIKRGLTNIRTFMVVTTYNAPRWFMLLYLWDPGRRVLMRGFTRLIAAAPRAHYLAHYDMLRSTAASRKRFLARIDRTLDSF